jgi:hypothetical protein
VQGDADTVSNIASSMFNVLRVFQGEPRIAEMAAKSLRGLSGTEENKRQVVAAGNIPLLCDIVMSSTVKEVIVGTCGLFARLATLPDVRQRYLHGLVPNLTSFLVNNDPELHIPIVTILEAISKDRSYSHEAFYKVIAAHRSNLTPICGKKQPECRLL